jgi:hypothetical protein
MSVLDKYYKEIESLTNAEALAYARERCDAEGGDWCILVDDLGGGDRSIHGVNNLGSVTITAKRTYKKHKTSVWIIVAAVVLITGLSIWYFKTKKK